MPKPKKDNHPVTIRMEESVYERLCEFCEESGQSKTIAIERAIMMYVDDYDKTMKLLNKKGTGQNE